MLVQSSPKSPDEGVPPATTRTTSSGSQRVRRAAEPQHVVCIKRVCDYDLRSMYTWGGNIWWAHHLFKVPGVGCAAWSHHECAVAM